MNFQAAAQILAAHGHTCRESTQCGHIDVLAIGTLHGQPCEEWETIPLTRSALFVWMGY